MAGPAGTIASGKARRIHRLHGRRPDQFGGAGEGRDIGIKRTRIGGEVFVRRKLCRVDEDRDDDMGRSPARLLGQGEVAGVQGAHRRHERDLVAGLA